MSYDDIKSSLDQARIIMDNADSLARRSVPFITGRLRSLHIPAEELRALKRELQSFDSQKMRWRR